MWLSAPIRATAPSPVVEAKRWIAGKAFPAEKPLINVSQAAPIDAPPEALRRALAEAALSDSAAHIYGPVLGMPELRAAYAASVSARYGATATPEDVAITSGCNQAFAATMATLAGPGDEVILPTPWYFNHKMWLDMSGVTTRPLFVGADMLPDIDAARALITPKTRAIVLVTPNNPAGVEYPPALIRAFYELARAHGLTLALDETYRDFTQDTGAPHDLLSDPAWRETVVQLYSFSKAYRLTGHRVGAITAAPARLEQAEKALDTVTICPNGLAQRAALFGLTHLGGWLAGERAEILARSEALKTGFGALDGWTLLSAGAYFAYVRHPFSMPSGALARAMVEDAHILALPGSMFTPEGAPESGPLGAACLRIAIANLDQAGIKTLLMRLAALAGRS